VTGNVTRRDGCAWQSLLERVVEALDEAGPA
jgi:hypothetical protein